MMAWRRKQIEVDIDIYIGGWKTEDGGWRMGDGGSGRTG